ncbi:putative glycosidase [Helianthus anomalus]
MAFSTSHGGGISNVRRASTTWTRSLLPFTTTKSTKHTRKSRKRSALIDFFFANFFLIALSASILFFLLVFYLYGIPKPVISPLRTGRTGRTSVRLRKPVYRKSTSVRVSNGSVNVGLESADVDITTKDLYERIEFKDEDGGPWKQGWRVSYKGDEWDEEKLKVFVVPHSHNDPGWKLTVEEYYDRQSKHILDTIVETLLKDERRKFIWEEMSYLERWWRDAPDAKKEALVRLLQNGQLEIVGGGWVMNDEANSHYFAIIEQMMEGNMWLNETIGVIPKNSWAIDPFGYSSTMAYLLKRMGFENMLIQRTHYELKKELALHQNLEYIWRQSWDTYETTDIFVHMMPFYSYDIPHTCGPEPAVCCQFDFARMYGFMYERCPWGQHPEETTQENVKERALKLLDQYKKKSTLYRTNTLLIPLGDDFRYISIDEAEAQFRNYQMLFDYINSSPELNTEAKFGTLEDYFRTVREEAEKINYTRPGEIGSGQVPGFPSLSGDFFTYADRQQDYWSGYYVSRPFFKSVDRVLEHTLRATEMTMAFLLGFCQRAQCEKLPTGFTHKLTAARRNLALFQHHDGVTGTAKDHVVQDYGMRMHTSLQDLQIFMSKAIEVLLGIHHDKNDQKPSLFEPAQVRSRFDAQPVNQLISANQGTVQSVVILNSLEQTRNEIVMFIVERPDVTILDSNWTCVKSQISPELQHNKMKMFTGRHRVFFKASVPAMGLQTYYIANGFVGCEKAKPAKLKITSIAKSLPCFAPYSCSQVEGDSIQIRNRHQALTFDSKFGLLQKVTETKTGSENVIDVELAMYTSPESGAYLFKPNGDAKTISETGSDIVVSEGSLVQEVFSIPQTGWAKSPVSHSTRVYICDGSVQELLIENEYHVELIGHEFNDKELVVRYKTDIDNKRIFYSDLNGFQMSRRETYDKIPLQGNYYPMPSLAFMQESKGSRFSIHTRQSLGVASPKNGWFEIMLDRRLSRDDGRGLGQGVMDNHPMNVMFHFMFESNISSVLDPVSHSGPISPSLYSHRVGAHLNHPLHAFIAKKPQEISVQPPPRSFSPLTAPLPCDLHVVSFKVPRPLKYTQQNLEEPRTVLILQRRHWDSSYCRKGRSDCSRIDDENLNLLNMFQGLDVLNAKATSLNLLHDDTEMLGYGERVPDVSQGRLVILPMELHAYKFDLRPVAS